jgi:hypothetical protein
MIRTSVLALFAATSSAFAETSIDTLLDPIPLQNSLDETTGAHWIRGNRNLSTAFDYRHSFLPTFAAGVVFPVVWAEPDSAGTRLPRSGGGRFDRIYLEAINRVMGNSRNFLDFEIQLGFPFQTDPQTRGSTSGTWLVGAGLNTHFRVTSHFALDANLSDSSSLPKVTQAPRTNRYADPSNVVAWGVQAFFYPNARWDLRATYSERPPFSVQLGADNDTASVITRNRTSARQRLWGGGIDVALSPAKWLVALDGTYFSEAAEINRGGTHWSARIKWLF